MTNKTIEILSGSKKEKKTIKTQESEKSMGLLEERERGRWVNTVVLSGFDGRSPGPVGYSKAISTVEGRGRKSPDSRNHSNIVKTNI